VRTWLIALAVALALLVGRSSPARADGATDAGQAQDEPADPAARASARYALAEAEDARGDYGRAVIDYRAAVAALPSFRYAAKAMMRAALLDAHSEGNWVPFAQLEAVRRDPSASNDPKAIAALAASADDFPPGPTRSEARMLCAEAYMGRLHRRADGEVVLRKVVDDPKTDGLLRREAAIQLVNGMIDDGDLAAAQTTALELGRTLDVTVAQKVTERLRRSRVHLASIVDLVLFVLLAGVAIGRTAARGAIAEVGGALRQMLPFALAFGAYVALMGGVLASTYETGNAEPFIAFGAVLVPVAVAATAWGAAGSRQVGARVGRAILSATAVAAAAFLVLEAINGQYLEGFNL
jgi:hypothetical protein